MGLGNLPEQSAPLRYSMVLLSLIPDSGKSGIMMGMGMIMIPDPSPRWTPDPRQIGDGTPITIPGQIGDGDGDSNANGPGIAACQWGSAPWRAPYAHST